MNIIFRFVGSIIATAGVTYLFTRLVEYYRGGKPRAKADMNLLPKDLSLLKPCKEHLNDRKIDTITTNTLLRDLPSPQIETEAPDNEASEKHSSPLKSCQKIQDDRNIDAVIDTLICDLLSPTIEPSKEAYLELKRLIKKEKSIDLKIGKRIAETILENFWMLEKCAQKNADDILYLLISNNLIDIVVGDKIARAVLEKPSNSKLSDFLYYALAEKTLISLESGEKIALVILSSTENLVTSIIILNNIIKNNLIGANVAQNIFQAISENLEILKEGTGFAQNHRTYAMVEAMRVLCSLLKHDLVNPITTSEIFRILSDNIKYDTWGGYFVKTMVSAFLKKISEQKITENEIYSFDTALAQKDLLKKKVGNEIVEALIANWANLSNEVQWAAASLISSLIIKGLIDEEIADEARKL